MPFSPLPSATRSSLPSGMADGEAEVGAVDLDGAVALVCLSANGQRAVRDARDVLEEILSSQFNTIRPVLGGVALHDNAERPFRRILLLRELREDDPAAVRRSVRVHFLELEDGAAHKHLESL